jgi:hypothetical protein
VRAIGNMDETPLPRSAYWAAPDIRGNMVLFQKPIFIKVLTDLTATLDSLEEAAADALPQFKPEDCADFFAHARYSLD